MPLAPEVTLERFFAQRDESRALFDVVNGAVQQLGPAEVRATKSQVAFRRGVAFAWVWVPGQYLDGDRPPLVLTVDLRRKDESPRWKQVVEVRPGRFVHHLEVRSADEIDEEVRGWLKEAWAQA
jgi:hypothetical protein